MQNYSSSYGREPYELAFSKWTSEWVQKLTKDCR